MNKSRPVTISALLLLVTILCSMLTSCGETNILDKLKDANSVDALLDVYDNFTLSTEGSETNGSYVYTADAFFGRDNIALHEENNFGMGYYYSCAYRGGEAFETNDEVLGYKQFLFVDEGDYAESYDKAVAEWTADLLPYDGETVVSDVVEGGKRVITAAATLDELIMFGTKLTTIEATYTVDEKSLMIESKEIVYKGTDGNAVLRCLMQTICNSPESTLFDELKAKVVGDESRTVTVVKVPSGEKASLIINKGCDAVLSDVVYTDEACTEVYDGGAYLFDDLTVYYPENRG